MDYVSLKAMATRMLGGAGMTMTHTRRITGAYDPATGSVALTELTQTAQGVVVSGSEKNRKGDATTLALTRVYVDATGMATPPNIGDELTFSGLKYTITVVDNVAPGGVVVVWDLMLSSGS
jgi:co-chaperonin GroES (HSP10)